MDKLSEELKYCLDNSGCIKCKYGELKGTIICGNLLQAVYERIKEYETLEEQGKLLKLPCAVGDTVYVLAECENIPEQLDGTIYDSDGSPGTATGYYCPYEDNCLFDDEEFDDCEKRIF